jgi:adhesin transport system outer membrane protein
VDEVLSTHPVVLERLHNYRATLEDLRITEAQYLPTLDYSASVAREKTKSPTTQNVSRSLSSYEHSLELTQNLFNGFGTVYEADYQKARILAASNHYIENANDIAYSFVNIYINALKNRDLLCIAKANVIQYGYLHKVTNLRSRMTTESEKRRHLFGQVYVVAKIIWMMRCLI